jgi:2-oxo-3-hexenedioate decarboxylase
MDIQDIADEAFALLGTGRQVARFSARQPRFALEDAYRAAAAIRTQREMRGERTVGRKIGFTNRTIWNEYNVHAPIWGYIYDRTVHDLPKGDLDVPLSGLAEPRIEPEIVFGLATAPAPGMDNQALLGCIDWIAHGFEIVQSIFPGWKFLAPDTIAAYGLHGALWIGPRRATRSRRQDWERELSSFEIDLFRNGVRADHGRAANVLGGPLFALGHLVEVLAADQFNPPLTAGEIVTTGTLTRAFPALAGELWTTELEGIPLEDARIRFI